MTAGTEVQWVQVEIPVKFAGWFREFRRWPVLAWATASRAQVAGGEPYILHAVNNKAVTAGRCLRSGSILNMGTITPSGIVRPTSEAARHDLGVIRTLLYKATYPAPMAYEMPNRRLVHPGDCFLKHPSALVRRTLYSVRNDEARCDVCEERFE
jgi:hypothetical protein